MVCNNLYFFFDKKKCPTNNPYYFSSLPLQENTFIFKYSLCTIYFVVVFVICYIYFLFISHLFAWKWRKLRELDKKIFTIILIRKHLFLLSTNINAQFAKIFYFSKILTLLLLFKSHISCSLNLEFHNSITKNSVDHLTQFLEV